MELFIFKCLLVGLSVCLSVCWSTFFNLCVFISLLWCVIKYFDIFHLITWWDQLIWSHPADYERVTSQNSFFICNSPHFTINVIKSDLGSLREGAKTPKACYFPAFSGSILVIYLPSFGELTTISYATNLIEWKAKQILMWSL